MSDELSLSSRRAWIEIFAAITAYLAQKVALLTESVDRNDIDEFRKSDQKVALLTESVDRNHNHPPSCSGHLLSLSSRRAWIEMPKFQPVLKYRPRSLSSRRAWIEIQSKSALCLSLSRVALLTESVDRNNYNVSGAQRVACRSPLVGHRQNQFHGVGEI